MVFPKFVSFCIQTCSNFILWVSFLAGVVNWKYNAKLRTLLLLERCKICGKVDLFWSILACVIHTLSEFECVCAEGRAESTLLLSFLCKVLRRKDSLLFQTEKIDSGVLWHNFSIFTHTEVRVLFFSFFFFFF